MPLSRIFNVENMSFNAIRENKFNAKISEFTVTMTIWDIGLQHYCLNIIVGL